MNSLIVKYYVLTQMRVEQFAEDQRGVTAIEYALIAVAMATLLAYILGNQDTGFLGALKKTFDAITQAITSVTIAGTGSNP
ncbi:Flp family type IVb pilin [Serratia marcescens]|uniref:Flp family type IVb pilin n=1 Tax=Serratia marcescens TaxID=615 RepID=UPI000E2C9031|nr:Flp family type IVb pilin [Serratia marcescens]